MLVNHYKNLFFFLVKVVQACKMDYNGLHVQISFTCLLVFQLDFT